MGGGGGGERRVGLIVSLSRMERSEPFVGGHCVVFLRQSRRGLI